MLKAVITGDEHPKKVVIVSDDKNGENVMLAEGDLAEFAPDLARKFQNTPLDGEGLLKVKIPTEDIGDFIDFLEGSDFFNTEAYSQLSAMRSDAMDQAEAKLAGE